MRASTPLLRVAPELRIKRIVRVLRIESLYPSLGLGTKLQESVVMPACVVVFFALEMLPFFLQQLIVK